MSDRERWQSRYGIEDYLFGTEPTAFLKRQADHLMPGQKALAIADGEGRNGVWLAEKGLDVLSIDFSDIALAKARKLAASRGVRLKLEQADLSQWPFPVAAFDVVAAIFIQFADPVLRVHIFDGIRQALKPGGLLLLHGYRPKQLEYRTGGPGQIEHLYTRELLLEAFGDYDILLLEEHDSEIREGAGHSGMSALIDLVARKP